MRCLDEDESTVFKGFSQKSDRARDANQLILTGFPAWGTTPANPGPVTDTTVVHQMNERPLPVARKPSIIMATTYGTHPVTTATPASESHVVHQTHTLLKCLFTVVPIVAGVDKFTNLLASWETYLNPLVLNFVPLSAATFMHVVGIIEIVAGVLVFLRPRLGGFVVMAWLLAIAAQLVLWGRFLDIAVRDIVIALSGPLVLARLTPFISDLAHRETK